MKTNLFEKLYYLSFTLKGDPVKVITSITDAFRRAMDFKQVAVYTQTLEGLHLLASSPAMLCEKKGYLCYDINIDGEKAGELWIATKRNTPVQASRRKIIFAFIAQLGSLLKQKREAQAGKVEDICRYRKLLNTDQLTGLYNRYYFEESVDLLQKQKIQPVSIIMIDVDGLKKINDTLGHRYGDQMLAATASLLKRTFRKGDLVARIGGDEFAVILPHASQNIVEKRCASLSRNMEIYNKQNHFPPLRFSFGAATSTRHTESIRSLLEEADMKMYEQKRNNYQKAINCLPLCPPVQEMPTAGLYR